MQDHHLAYLKNMSEIDCYIFLKLPAFYYNQPPVICTYAFAVMISHPLLDPKLCMS